MSVWRVVWPKLAAIAIAIALWELVVLTGWRPEYLLPSPWSVAKSLGNQVSDADFWKAILLTIQRAIIGFGLAIFIGTVLGFLVARFSVLRSAFGSLVTGLQTMPSIAWFPLAILLFQLTERAILFVVVLGAAPSIANGLVAGVDHVPPLLLRAGRASGASATQLHRFVALPAALPSFVGGLTQGWAFAWRSLMAGELLVVIGNHPSLGVRLQYAREVSDAPGLLAIMIVILVFGICVDTIFRRIDMGVRKRWGLLESV